MSLSISLFLSNPPFSINSRSLKFSDELPVVYGATSKDLYDAPILAGGEGRTTVLTIISAVRTRNSLPYRLQTYKSLHKENFKGGVIF